MVLILVLVEDGLGAETEKPTTSHCASLNPCFSGGWSRRNQKHKMRYTTIVVLILVLVEDGLGE